MGQGVHTKMIQIAAEVLDVPTSAIYFNETSTMTVPNTSPSAASSTTDILFIDDHIFFNFYI